MTTDLPALCERLRDEATRGSQHYAAGFRQSGHLLVHPDDMLALLAAVERAALTDAVCQSMYALETHNNAVNDDEKWPDYAKWLQVSVSLNRVHRDAYAAWRAARDGAGDDGDGVR